MSISSTTSTTLSIPLTKNPALTAGDQSGNGYFINIGIPYACNPDRTLRPSWNVLIDTGSCGLVIPAALLYQSGVALQGPLIQGVQQLGAITIPYQPSDLSLDGYIYQLDSINIGVDAQGKNPAYVATNVKIVGVYNNKNANMGMMGVGFGRPNPFADNLLLASGSNVNASYLLTTDSLTLGYTAQTLGSVGTFQYQQLQAEGADWKTPTATITVSGYPQFTGTALLDTGINSMMLSLPGDDWRTKLQNQTVAISWAGNTSGSSIRSYQFQVGGPQALPEAQPQNSLIATGSPACPSGVIPVRPEVAAPPTVFVNTGINPIQLGGYFYDSVAGVVGFQQ